MNGTLVFLLALAVGIVGGALAHRWAIRKSFSEVARIAAAVAGFLIGFILTHIVINNL